MATINISAEDWKATAEKLGQANLDLQSAMNAAGREIDRLDKQVAELTEDLAAAEKAEDKDEEPGEPEELSTGT